MKRTFLLPALALAVFASQAFSAPYAPCPSPNNGFCYWPATATDPQGCYTINTGANDQSSLCATEYENCLENGTLYYDVTYEGDEYGAGKTCTELGGVWSQKGNDPNYNDGVPLFCKWDTGCESVKSDTEKAKCEADGSLFKDVPTASQGTGKDCSGGEWIGGKDPTLVVLGCCKWDTETRCYNIMSGEDEDGEDGETKVASCKTGANQFWEGACPTTATNNYCPTTPPFGSSSGSSDGNSSSSGTDADGSSSSGTTEGGSSSSGATDGGNSSSSGDGTPIISLSLKAQTNSLSAMSNGINLAVAKSAVVKVYDMKGNAVSSYRFAQGSYNVSFSDLPRGLYIVKASGASWSKTITVPVK